MEAQVALDHSKEDQNPSESYELQGGEADFAHAQSYSGTAGDCTAEYEQDHQECVERNHAGQQARCRRSWPR